MKRSSVVAFSMSIALDSASAAEGPTRGSRVCELRAKKGRGHPLVGLGRMHHCTALPGRPGGGGVCGGARGGGGGRLDPVLLLTTPQLSVKNSGGGGRGGLWGGGGVSRVLLGGGGRVLEPKSPKVRVPKTAKSIFPFVKFHFLPR